MRGGRLVPGGSALLAAALVGLAAGCAQQGAPPGGPTDVRPPVVVRTQPDTYDVGTEFDGPVRFEFDERISESVGGGPLDEAVSVSPRTGAVRVGHRRRSLVVELEGGFRPGLVYRVTLQPVVRDMFGNQLRDPFELVFSTGGEDAATTLAGEVWDRVTGRGMARASLQAVGRDSLIHVAISDAEGIYAFRYLPEGAFRLTGFVDQDRDGEVDASEIQGTRDIMASAGDTLLIDVPVLEPDSTPAVLLRSEMLDSVTLALEFDDFLEPSAPLGEVGLRLESDGASLPSVQRLWHEHEYADFVEAVTDSLARLDSLDAVSRPAEVAAQVETPVADPLVATDTLVAADTLDVEVAEDSVASVPARQLPPRLERARGSDSALPGRPVLPGTRLVALLGTRPAPGVEFRVVVSGVVNLNGLDGGGGESVIMIQAPPPDSVPGAPAPDTMRASSQARRVLRTPDP